VGWVTSWGEACVGRGRAQIMTAALELPILELSLDSKQLVSRPASHVNQKKQMDKYMT